MTIHGVKKGYVRPKAPSSPAKDTALCTVKDGATPNSKWYVGEMGARTGGFCKCWKIFDLSTMNMEEEEVNAMTVEDLQKLAWELVQGIRERRNDSDEVKATLLTPEQDQAALDALKASGKPMPSKAAAIAKQRNVAVSRRKRGLRSDGQKYACGGLGRTMSGQMVKSASQVTREAMLANMGQDCSASSASTDVGSNSSYPGSPVQTTAWTYQHGGPCAAEPLAAGAESPNDYPVYYSADDLVKHGLSVEDLVAAGLPAVTTVDGGAVLGNIAYLTAAEQQQLFHAPAAPAPMKVPAAAQMQVDNRVVSEGLFKFQ